MANTLQSDLLVIGGGLAGLVTAYECLLAGKSVILVDRDTRERLGGLALWAFGGMALVDTPLQRRMKIKDSPEIALRDWIRFGEINEADLLPRQWVNYYVQHCRSEVYDWLLGLGLKFLPAVNWVERGMQGNGNTLPRYHILWGTSRQLIRCMIENVLKAGGNGRFTLLTDHRVTSIEYSAGIIDGAVAINESNQQEVRLQSTVVVMAMGGINGSHEQVRLNWPKDRPMPSQMLNGAHPFADGKLHQLVAELGGQITHASEMWNYAAGFPHPFPHFEGHGLSSIPCKSALWLNHHGERIGPEPLITGFDTYELCQRVAAQEKPYTWHLLNWRIAATELAISGAEHNQRIRDRQFPQFIKETLFGNHRLVKQLAAESKHFLVDDTLAGLAAKMNSLTDSNDIKPEILQATVDAFDANFANGKKLQNDDQIRRIHQARQWGPDKL
ncbi:MAG TPA: FAD-binding protein, partial [Arenimonas sp.]|nr:FAD-binding protein [Arenimonas sp.]